MANDILTTDFLVERNACQEGIDWVAKQPVSTYTDMIKRFIDAGHFAYAHWLLMHTLEKDHITKYATFVVDKVKIREIQHTEAHKIGAYARTPEEWVDASVGYLARHIEGYTDSNYAQDAVQAAVYCCILKDDGSRERILTNAMNYACKLLAGIK